MSRFCGTCRRSFCFPLREKQEIYITGFRNEQHHHYRPVYVHVKSRVTMTGLRKLEEFHVTTRLDRKLYELYFTRRILVLPSLGLVSLGLLFCR